MRRLGWIAVAALAALAAAGIAFAHGFADRSAAAVTGTFVATNVTGAKTATCSNGDGTWTRTRATYTGTAAGDPDLAGPAKLRIDSTVNTSKNVGVVEGTMRIDTAHGADTFLRFTGAYQGGTVVGVAVGRAHAPAARIVANLSASFSQTGGFTNGRIGGADGGAAVEIVPGSCRKAPKPPPDKPVLRARATVVSASSTSVVVRWRNRQAELSVPSSLADAAAKLQPGDRVAVVAAQIDGNYVLVSLKTRK